MKWRLKLGSYQAITRKNNFFLGAVSVAIEEQAQALMIYTGPPQNTLRIPVEDLKINEGLKLLKKSNIDLKHCVVHAPYIINLATDNQDNSEFALQFFIKEIERTAAFKFPYLVFHPGFYTTQDPEVAINRLIKQLKIALKVAATHNITLCLETMSGKGSEIGKNFQELATIIKGCDFHPNLGVCFDTCHLHAAGYNLNNKLKVLQEFDNLIGLKHLKVLHANDSFHERGEQKDRHANPGCGYIGFNLMLEWLHDSCFENIPIILETPFLLPNNPTTHKILAPYKMEIFAFQEKKWPINYPLTHHTRTVNRIAMSTKTLKE